MRKLLEYSWKRNPLCEHINFIGATQSEKQGYICALTRERCVGHATLPVPYLGLEEHDTCGLYAILRKRIVERCPSREHLQENNREQRRSAC